MSFELPECLRPKPVDIKTQQLLAALKKASIINPGPQTDVLKLHAENEGWDGRDGRARRPFRDTRYADSIREQFTGMSDEHTRASSSSNPHCTLGGAGDDHYDDDEEEDRSKKIQDSRGLDFFVDRRTNQVMPDIEGVSTVAAVPEIREYGYGNEIDFDITQIKNKYFNESHTNSKVHQELPISSYRDKIRRAVKAYNVVIIQGHTGCGKTTQVPQFILEDALLQRKQPVNIFCTQPRKIAARSVAKRVCQENGWELGSLVGYQVGLDALHRTEDTMLTYCTTGVLVERIISEKSLKNYSHIIVDEVHERDIDTDILLMLIRWYMKIEPITFSLIIMSATMDVDKLLSYFRFRLAFGHMNSNQSLPIKISHTSKNTNSVFYLDYIKSWDQNHTLGSSPGFDIEAPEFMEYCVNVAVYLFNEVFRRIDNRDTNPLAVLVFLPGLNEINQLDKQLRKNISELDIRLLHSSLPSEEQNRVFEPAISGKRKVILSTNIAESSITLPDIGYVVDFCLSKCIVKDQRTRFPMLQLQWASKDKCTQRAGRAGRVMPGKVFRLVPEHFYLHHIPAYTEPELLSAPLEHTVLRTKKSSIAPPIQQLGLMIDPPPLKEIRSAIIELKQIGALTVKMDGKLDREDGHVTELGNVICTLPIDVHLSKLVVIGYIFDCLNDCLILAACLSGRGIVRSSYTDDLGDFRKRLSWSKGAFSDLFVYLEAYKEYTRHVAKSKTFLKKWCDNEHLDLKKLQEVDLLLEELKMRLARLNIFVEDQPNRNRDNDQDELMLKFTFCAAFYPNFFVSKPIDQDLVTRVFHDSDPARSVYLENIPREQGPIYKNQIVREFESISDNLEILFAGSRAVVVFNDCDAPLGLVDDEENVQKYKPRGFVNESVYLALKLGMSYGVSIREFNPTEANKRIEYYDNRWKDMKAKSTTITSTRIKLVDYNRNIRPKRFNWVPINNNSFFLRIMNIVECCHFYARLEDPRVTQYEDDLSEIINDTDFELATCSRNIEQMIGTIAFTRHPKYLGKARPGSRNVMEGYHRIEIRSVPTTEKRKVQVYFYDFGLTCMISENDIYVIPEDFEQTYNRLQAICAVPILAIECKIHGIKPASWATTWGGWSDNAQIDFKDKLLSSDLDRRFEARVFSYCDQVVRLDLIGASIRDSLCDSTSLRHRLITMGEGVAIEEPEVSLRDHKVREDYLSYPVIEGRVDTDAFCEIERNAAFDDYDFRELKRLEVQNRVNGRNFARKKDMECEVTNEDDPTSLFKSTYTQLRGPLSPITLCFQGLSAKSSRMPVFIERDSINSVSVDADYLDKRYQLMIASSVTISSQGKLKARDTTLMPKIHGLPTIISLLFAPYYEFRTNPELCCLSGALFGLGCDDKGEPIDPENDIEIDFDCLITKRDVDDVNMCRKAMTELISKLHIENSNEPTGCLQQGVRNSIMNLIRKRRLPMKEYCHENFAKWDKYEEMSSTYGGQVESARFLPPVYSPVLDDDEIYRRIRFNLNQIENLVEKREKLTIEGVMCLLCDSGQGRRYISMVDFRNHLESDKHLTRLQEFDVFEQFRAKRESAR